MFFYSVKICFNGIQGLMYVNNRNLTSNQHVNDDNDNYDMKYNL